MACLFIWAMGALILLQDYLQGQPIRIWAVNLTYIGVILTPVAALYLGLVFAHNTVKLRYFHLLSLLIPAISLILLFTNEHHGAFYTYYDYAHLTSADALGWYLSSTQPIRTSVLQQVCLSWPSSQSRMPDFSQNNQSLF